MYKFSGPDHLVECTTAGGVIRRHKSSREERIEKRKKQDEAWSKSPPSHFNSVRLAMDLEVPAGDFVLHTGTPRTRRFATGFQDFLTFIVLYPRIVVDIVILYRLGHNMPMFTDRGAMPSFLRSGNPSLALSHLSYFCWCAPHKTSSLIFLMLVILSSTAGKMLESSKFIHISITFALVRQNASILARELAWQIFIII